MGFFSKSSVKEKKGEASSTNSSHDESDVDEEFPRDPSDTPSSYAYDSRPQTSMVPYSNRQQAMGKQLIMDYHATKELFETGIDIVENGVVTRIRATKECVNKCGAFCDPSYTFDECETCRRGYIDVLKDTYKGVAQVRKSKKKTRKS